MEMVRYEMAPHANPLSFLFLIYHQIVVGTLGEGKSIKLQEINKMLFIGCKEIVMMIE